MSKHITMCSIVPGLMCIAGDARSNMTSIVCPHENLHVSHCAHVRGSMGCNKAIWTMHGHGLELPHFCGRPEAMETGCGHVRALACMRSSTKCNLCVPYLSMCVGKFLRMCIMYAYTSMRTCALHVHAHQGTRALAYAQCASNTLHMGT